MKTILAPIDLSAVSKQVVARATELAEALGARVVLLTCLIPPVFLQEFAPAPEKLAQLMTDNEADVTQRLAKIREQIARTGIPTETVVRRGGPVTCILEEARKCRPSFIVMGSHGHTAFYDLVAGSTTHGVLKRSPCPLVIVPAAPKPARRRRRT